MYIKHLFYLSLCVTHHIFANNYPIKSIYDVYNTENSNIRFYKCYNSIPFRYEPLPVAEYSYFHPHVGCFDQSGVYSIPQGKAYIADWYLIFDKDNNILKEFIPTSYTPTTHLNNVDFAKIDNANPNKISGTVAVITGLAYENYGHWLGEILAKLQLLCQSNINYDWLYFPYEPTFCKEILSLLNIDTSKLIQLHNDYIQADTLIVPSLPARFIPQQNYHNYAQQHFATLYIPQWHVDWLRETFIPLASKSYNNTQLHDKIFISRKDAPVRAILNEDELFTYFEKLGFKRYNLASMSFLEQVELFHQAKYIVSAHGAGLTNIIFCNRDVTVIEIFQNQFDSTFWYISQTLGLQHHCIKTQNLQPTCRKNDTSIPTVIIERYIHEKISITT